MQKEAKKVIDLVKVNTADLVACTLNTARFVHKEINGAHMYGGTWTGRYVDCRQRSAKSKKYCLYTIEWSYFLLGQKFNVSNNDAATLKEG